MSKDKKNRGKTKKPWVSPPPLFALRSALWEVVGFASSSAFVGSTASSTSPSLAVVLVGFGREVLKSPGAFWRT